MEAVAIAAVATQAYGIYEGGRRAESLAEDKQAADYQAARDNEIIARENMAIAYREAVAIEKRGAAAVGLKRKEISRLLAYQRVQEAVSGFRYTGTPLLVALESAAEGELDVSMIWSNALTDAERTRARGRVIQLEGGRIAGQLRAAGDISMQQGVYAATASYYEGASTLLKGVSSYMAATK